FPRSYTQLSESRVAHAVSFSSGFEEAVDVSTPVKIVRSGTVTGLCLTSTTTISEDVGLGSCVSYCQPVILPVPDMAVSEGDEVTIDITYEMGRGFDALTHSV